MEDFKVPKIGLSLTAGYMARFIDETIEKFRGGKLLEGLSGMFPVMLDFMYIHLLSRK
jgi:hypothetical protein